MQKNIIIVGKDIIIAKRLNNFFVEAVEILEIEPFAPDFDKSTPQNFDKNTPQYNKDKRSKISFYSMTLQPIISRRNYINWIQRWLA